MIAQTSTAASIGSLTGYLSHGKAANNNRVEDRDERVAWESGRNLRRAQTIKEAKEQFRRAAARKARRVEKPYYQVIVSWQSGNDEEGIPPDNPSREEMEEVVGWALSELGLEEHQAWTVAHRDTSTPHVHVAVNRVHPRTGETWSPSYDQTTLYHTLREIEEVKGWHRPGPMNIEDLAKGKRRGLEYWEEQAGKFGRERSVRRWAREEEIACPLKNARSWEQAEKILHRTEATFKPRRERGMVIGRDGGHAALSSIDPEISRPKLEERYGQPWEAYEEERLGPKERLSEKLSRHASGTDLLGDLRAGEDLSEGQIEAYRLAEKIVAIRRAEQTQKASEWARKASGQTKKALEQAGEASKDDTSRAGASGAERQPERLSIETESDLTPQEEKARQALVMLADRLRGSPEAQNPDQSLRDQDGKDQDGKDQGGLKALESRLGGPEAAVLRVARLKTKSGRGGQWMRGAELPGAQKIILSKAKKVQRYEEKRQTQDSSRKHEDLRIEVSQAETKDFRELAAALEVEVRTRSPRPLSPEASLSEEFEEDTQRIRKTWEIIRGEQDVALSSLPEEALSFQEERALSSLRSLRAEQRKLPQGFSIQTSIQEQIRLKEKRLQRNLQELSLEEIAELREHLSGWNRRLQELETHCQKVLKKQFQENVTDTTGKIKDLLQKEDRASAGELFLEAQAEVENIEAEIRSIRESLRGEIPNSGSGEGGSGESPGDGASGSSELKRRLKQQVEEALRGKDLSRFKASTAEARALRAKREAQQDFSALDSDQNKAAWSCQVAAYLDCSIGNDSSSDNSQNSISLSDSRSSSSNVSRFAQKHVERAANFLGKMSTEKQEEVRQAVIQMGAQVEFRQEARETFEKALAEAKSKGRRQERSESSGRSRSGGGRSGRSRGR